MHIRAFEILADQTRRLVVEALREGERPVNATVQQAGIHQSGEPRHLRILSETAFVSVKPDWRQRLDALRPEPFRQIETRLSVCR